MANVSIPSLPGAGGRPSKGIFGFGAAGLAVAGLLLILLYIISPFFTVGEYERTVVTRFGQFHSLAGPGLHFRIPFVNGLETFPIGIQRMQKDHLNTYTVDNQELDALVTLNYRIPEGEVRRVFTTNRDYRANLESFMIDRFKREMGKINITQVAAHRGDVALAVQKSLEGGGPVVVRHHHRRLPDQRHPLHRAVPSAPSTRRPSPRPRSSSPSRSAARRRSSPSARRSRPRARPTRRARQARGKADGELLLSTAQAKGKELVGLAEAKALEAQGQAIRSNDALIQLEFAKRWSGNLPVNMYASAPLPFLNLHQPETQTTSTTPR